MMRRYIMPLFAIGLLFAQNANAQTIFDALSEAYKSNPDLQAQRAYLRAIDENVAIAKSGYRPNMALTAGYADSDHNSTTQLQDEGARNYSMGAKVTQPLFNGLQTVNSVKAADSYVKAEQANLNNVEQLVFLSASEAYLNVVRDEALLGLQKNNESLLKKQLDETTERFNVGELTKTDVAQAMASHSQATANRISAEGNLQVSKAIYAQVIGAKAGKLSEPQGVESFLPNDFEGALKLSIDNNYSLQQAKQNLRGKGYDVKSNYGAMMPQVEAYGSASKGKSNYKYPGLQTNTLDDLELGVNLTVPLYQSGAERAKVRQSKYAKWQAHEQVLGAERSTVADITSYWETMISNRAKIKALQEQVKANEIALSGVKREEALGNRTILDVLDAYQYLLNAQVQVVSAKTQYYLSAMQVMQAMGKLTAKNLKLNVELYNAKQHSKDTRNKWLSTSVE